MTVSNFLSQDLVISWKGCFLKLWNLFIYRVQPKHWSSLWCSSSQKHLCRLCRCLTDLHLTVVLRWKSSRWESSKSQSTCLFTHLLLSLKSVSCLFFSGSNGPCEELPQTHGVLHAADTSNCLEHTDWKCSFISYYCCCCQHLVEMDHRWSMLANVKYLICF